mgnify:CR=1 FL=1
MAGSNRSRTAVVQTEARQAAPTWGAREVMDIRQAAEYLGISPDSLYKYASENFIPAFKLGNRWRFKRSLLESWMDQQSSLSVAPAREKAVKLKQKKPVARAR